MSALVQHLRPAYYADVEKQLRRIFWAILYQPLMDILTRATAQKVEIQNAEDPLRDALRSGRIQYSNGIFSGEFSASLSKALRRLGAAFDARSRVYRLDPGRVPGWVISEATTYAMKAKGTHEELLRVLNETTSHLESLVQEHPVDASRPIALIDDGFKHIADQIKVSPTLSPAARAELKREYTRNMSIDIQDFSQKEIVALRERVEINAAQGYRFDRLIASIKNRYSVTENKAAFLAFQETSMFLAKFRETRFADAGIQRYRWSDSHDARVRCDHHRLNGQVFFYKQPPIVNLATGKRANPGQDWRCRCVDIPVFEGQER